MIVINNKHAIACLSHVCRVMYNPLADHCLAVIHDDRVTGGCIYTDYNYVSIQMHVAWFEKHMGDIGFLQMAFDYPFNKLMVKKVFGLVAASNEKALAFDHRLGFTTEHIIRDVFPEGDAVVLGMYREDCRWLNLRPPRDVIRMG
jgi:RimJ/RimL family protein N-acetyltransferase